MVITVGRTVNRLANWNRYTCSR